MLYSKFAILAFAISACSAQSNNATVNLRVEGVNRTIFNGVVNTTGHDVKTPSGGEHQCDGTSGNINPHSGPTMISALDDASHIPPGFTWDGPFNSTLGDFSIMNIAGDKNQGNQTWGLVLNYELVETGGCLQEVNTGDNVLFAFDARDKCFLQLEVDFANITVGSFSTFTVTQGPNFNPVLGATLTLPGSPQTNSIGTVEIQFNQIQNVTVVANMDGCIRSNSVLVTVHK